MWALANAVWILGEPLGINKETWSTKNRYFPERCLPVHLEFDLSDPKAGVSGCERLQLRLCQLAFCCSYSADLWLCFLQGLAPQPGFFQMFQSNGWGGSADPNALKGCFLKIMDDMMVLVASPNGISKTLR